MTITREEAARKGVLTLPELMDYDPEFLTRRKAQAPDLEPTFDVDAGTVNSRFEDNVYLFEVDEEGTVLFGRLHKREKPAINAALIDSQRGLTGINVQVRRGGGGLFAQPVMGFNLKKAIGKATDASETDEAAAVREALEENGITVVRRITPLGVVMPNPTSFTSEVKVFVLDCDSTRVSDQLDFAEGIRSATWLSFQTLLVRMKKGVHEGVRYDHGPLLWTYMRLFAEMPGLFGR